MKRSAILLPCLAVLALPAAAWAQPLGTFRWQLQPHCNVVAVTITQVGGIYRLEGTDDQCGAGRDQASVLGMAFPNPDGSIGFGMTIVTAPGGVPVHVDAEMSIATLAGAWRDSAGGQGTFTLTPGAGTGGSPRPPVPPAIPSTIRLLSDGGLLARGTPGTGAIPASGPGYRMMWHAGKAAFRAGRVHAAEWDDGNVGISSTAFGVATIASGLNSTALGGGTTASTFNSTAMGSGTTASGIASTAMGEKTTAAGDASTALGELTLAGGRWALAAGYFTSATGDRSTSLGTNATTNAQAGSFIYGDSSTWTSGAFIGNDAPNQFMVRAAGGYKLFTNAALTAGVQLAPNGSSWAALSDVNAKENFRDVEGEEVLTKLARMPVREWNYKAQDATIRHMGPTAQDFRAAFELGDFRLRINTVDADGVALAGVKALEMRTRALQAEVEALRARLDALTAAPK